MIPMLLLATVRFEMRRMGINRLKLWLRIFWVFSFGLPSNGSVRNATYGDKPPEAMVANFLGLFIWFAVIAVVFVATRSSFQRQDIIEELSESDPMLG